MRGVEKKVKLTQEGGGCFTSVTRIPKGADFIAAHLLQVFQLDGDVHFFVKNADTYHRLFVMDLEDNRGVLDKVEGILPPLRHVNLSLPLELLIPCKTRTQRS